MSIASEVQRIKTNIANAYDKCEEKGATMPDNKNSANLASTIETISSGGGGVTRGSWQVPSSYIALEKAMTGTDNYLEALRDVIDASLTPSSREYNTNVGAMGFVLPPDVYSYTVNLYGKSITSLSVFGFRTSDGSYYDNIEELGSSYITVTHTFDNTKDLENGCKWIIVYYYLDQSSDIEPGKFAYYGQLQGTEGGYVMVIPI